MHARMLLPTAFALQLPVAALPVHRTTLALLGMVALWAIVPFQAGGPPYDGIGPFGITNERGLYAAALGNPVTVEDYKSTGLVKLGLGAGARAERGHPLVSIFLLANGMPSQPVDPDGPAFAQHGVYGIGAIGMTSIAAGNKVYIADELGLASPIGSRLELLKRSRPAHEKILPAAWVFAMFGDPKADVPTGISPVAIATARFALRCPAIARMLQRARAPLTLEQIGLNMIQSFTDFHTRIHPDPITELGRCRGNAVG
jgi:arabinofuranosyltransferase